jgi:hypothetical protein
MNFMMILLISGGLFGAMLLAHEVGRWHGRRYLERTGSTSAPGVGVIEGAVFALLGLLIAFTFSGAASRFDDRRQLIIDEGNAIGTAYLRVDLLPAASQPAVRQHFRSYLDARLAVYRAVPDLAKIEREQARVGAIQSQLWSEAVAAAAGSQPATMLLLPALNEMFDMASTRTLAARVHPPLVIFALLGGLAMLGAFLAGFATAGAQRQSWVHSIAFAAMLAGVVYVIVDLEFPRFGLIRVDAFDQALTDLRQSMN